MRCSWSTPLAPYAGSHLVDTSTAATTELAISADSAWTLKIEDIDSVPTSTDKVKAATATWLSTGMRLATRLRSPTRVKAASWCRASAARFPSCPVNKIGDYSGTVKVTPGFVQINSDGDWTIAAK